MSLVDVPDVFIGSTDDDHTFVVLNRPLRGARRMLIAAGFAARTVGGRTVYLLPPGTPEDANEKAGIAMYGLLAHTHDLVDLSRTTRWNPKGPAPGPDLRFAFTGPVLTATAATDEARSLLGRHGFGPSLDGTSYGLVTPVDELGLLSAVVRAEAHAHADGIGVRIDLGIPTPDAIPAPPRPASFPVPGSPAGPTRRRPH
ncbi:hypothetical protein GCM10010433_49400 [Streptomyces pulveraceus]|uniref:Uncharacterized protein n=1 Tax=Streptomyces pulveraceus TaxID=68258 RepID=A0ABW1GJR9_9ACTN